MNEGSITRPSHIYLDDLPYFITASTFQHRKLLNAEIKTRLQELLHRVFAAYHWRLDHWVILDNHYHLLASSCKGQDLPRIINKIHNQSAQQINELLPPERRSHKRVWYNYWDYCPRDEQDYNLRLCYLLNNPVKHGYVETLYEWPWSSFHKFYEDRGDTALRRLFHEHREYQDLQVQEDDL
jgi:putative transposase